MTRYVAAYFATAGVMVVLDLPWLGVVAKPLYGARPSRRRRSSVATVLGMLEEGLLTLAFDCRDHLVQLAALTERYADRNPDLADLCLVPDERTPSAAPGDHDRSVRLPCLST